MKVAQVFEGHNGAREEWERVGSKDWLLKVFDAPSLPIEPRCTRRIHDHVSSLFLNDGWALKVKLNQNSGINVFAEKASLAFQLQTGNMSRAPYDLLKLQYLFVKERIVAGALALPTKEAAGRMGQNIANSKRVVDELKLFEPVITVPILIVAFE